ISINAIDLLGPLVDMIEKVENKNVDKEELNELEDEEAYYQSILSSSQVEPLRIIIIEITVTDKSYLIK
ncbi:12540_t:CDS:2, partial [Cetraspora pellucida]